MRIACLLLAALAAACSSRSVPVVADRWGDRLAGGVTGPSAFWRKAVAPVFDHGIGYASTPFEQKLTPDPTTLEEAPAVAFVHDAFAKQGIALTERDVVVYHGAASHPDGARVRRTKHRDTGGGPWVMDLVDPERRIAVEFISKHDVDYLDSCEDTYTSSGWELGSCTLKLAARAVVRGLREGDVDPYVYLVFYDPTDDDDFVQLDAQIHDAIAWLREQGVLRNSTSF